MSINKVSKTELITNEILFSNNDPLLPDRIDISLVHGFVDIVSLDGSDNPVTPVSGSFDIYVKSTEDGGFKSLSDNGNIDAILTGGSSLADGVEVGASFSSNPIEIKVVPSSVVGAVSYKVVVTQNLT